MPSVNPHYDPDWKKLHDRYAAERTRLEKERNRLIAAGAMASNAYKQAASDFDHHHQACLASFKMQHATVQEYAAWLFREFEVSMGDWEGGIPVPVVDFEALHTIEEADTAWSRVHRIVSDSAAERRQSLPTGQPQGLLAFADAASPTLARYWREFSPRDLYPTGYAREGGTRTLMTVDEQSDGWHVCFMHDWDSVGMSVTNAIDRLATAVYCEARILAEQEQAPASGRMRGWLARRRVAHVRATMPVPERFHFYQHLPPRGGAFLSEQFDRVDMQFDNGEFRKPEWSGYRIIPCSIQSARFDCALDASVLGVQPGRPLICDRRVAKDEL